MSRIAEKKVEFPKWVNRPTRIIIFESDEVMVFVGCVFGTYFACMLLGVSLFATILLIGGVTFIAMKAYTAFKEGQAKGVIWHWLYIKNISKEKEDPKKYKDCELMDDLPIIPIGYEIYFKD